LENVMARSIVSRFALAASFAAASVLTTSLAFADAINPDEGACTGKTAGSACSIPPKTGVCADATCSRLDYENWDRDATAGPPSKDYPCVLCNTDGGAPADSGSGTDASPADAAHALGGDPSAPASSSSSSSCTVAAAVGVKAAAPLALAAVVPLGILLVGRRRRRS
jgi:hypothetical protein